MISQCDGQPISVMALLDEVLLCFCNRQFMKLTSLQMEIWLFLLLLG